LDVYRDNIDALYFPIPRQYFGSGRRIPQKSSYLKEVPEIIKKMQLVKYKISATVKCNI
jgi:hypothetical protein